MALTAPDRTWITDQITAAVGPLLNAINPAHPGSIAARLVDLEARFTAANIGGHNIDTELTNLRADMTALVDRLNPANPGIAHDVVALTTRVDEALNDAHAGSVANRVHTLEVADFAHEIADVENMVTTVRNDLAIQINPAHAGSLAAQISVLTPPPARGGLLRFLDPGSH